MSNPDVTQLADEQMADAEFPAARRQDYRLFLDAGVHEAIHKHASKDTSVEICGVLVGVWEKDGDGPFARVTNHIECESATSKFAEVTFTHESWAQINAEMDSKYVDSRIIGWYHSHPDFGIFLSDRDVFIQQNFFSGAGQVALVVDPVRKTEGVFEWRDGKTELMKHYWAGDRIVTSHAAENPTRPSGDAGAAAAGDVAAAQTSAASAPPPAMLNSLTTVLTWLCLFLLGYLFSSWRSLNEERMYVEGAIAHYGIWNIGRFGWEQYMTEMRLATGEIADRVGDLSKEHVELAGKDGKDVKKRWNSIRSNLLDLESALGQMESRYGLSKEEQKIRRSVVVNHVLAMGLGRKPSDFSPELINDLTELTVKFDTAIREHESKKKSKEKDDPKKRKDSGAGSSGGDKDEGDSRKGSGPAETGRDQAESTTKKKPIGPPEAGRSDSK